MNSALAALREVVTTRLGLSVTAERSPELERAACTALGVAPGSHDQECVHRLLSAPAESGEWREFANALTNGETYFFREMPALEAVAGHIFTALARKDARRRRPPVVWSAGCATGEEPYTLAILLRERLPNLGASELRIVATDLNTHSLDVARSGVYGAWSFRATTPERRERYFTSVAPGRWALNAVVRQMVEFVPFNLAEGENCAPIRLSEPVDAIVCRNVLMYLTDETRACSMRRFKRMLAPDGWLAVSPAEASRELLSGFAPLRIPGAALYTSAKEGPQSRPPALEPAQQTGKARQKPRPGAAQAPPTAPGPQDPHNAGEHRPDESAPHSAIDAGAGSPEQALLLARLLAGQGRLDEARQWCERAVAADGLNPEAYLLWATVLEERGELQDSAEMLRKALFLDPRLTAAHFALANLALRLGQAGDIAKHFANTLASLAGCDDATVLPQAGGITAGRLRAIVLARMGGSA